VYEELRREWVRGRRTRCPPSSPSFTCPPLRHILRAGHAPADQRQGAVGCDCIRKLHSAHGADLVVAKIELRQSERQWASALYRASAAFCKASKKKGESFLPLGNASRFPPKEACQCEGQKQTCFSVRLTASAFASSAAPASPILLPSRLNYAQRRPMKREDDWH